MSPTDDPVDVHLDALARSTLAAAPAPPPPALVRILAGRRVAQLRSRRLLALVAVAGAAPLLIVVSAGLLRPAGAGGLALAAAFSALALLPATGAIAWALEASRSGGFRSIP